MRRGKRRRLAARIYQDRAGISCVLQVRGHREELRFPLGTPIPTIRRDEQKRREQLEELIPEAPGRGTLAELVNRYLSRFPEGTSERRDRHALLKPWVDALGDQMFLSLSRSQLQEVADRWRQDGLSANRASKRISALRVAWDTLAPDHALPHPVTKVRRYRDPLPETRGVPMELVGRILAEVSETRDVKKGRPRPMSKSLARLKVLAWTGQPPARVMAIEAKHVRWDTTPPQLYVVPRRKGTGSADAWLPLLPQAVAALREMFKAEATGRFASAALGRVLARAVRKAQTKLRDEHRHEDADRIATFTVYSLRHSFLSALAATTRDIYATAEYAGHASLQTTRRYMKSIAEQRMAAAIDALSQILPPGSTNGSNAPPERTGRKRKPVAASGAKRRAERRGRIASNREPAKLRRKHE